MLALKQNNRRSLTDGFTAEPIVAVDPNAEPEPVEFHGGPPAEDAQAILRQLCDKKSSATWSLRSCHKLDP